jgi:hypothetical protein
MMGVDAAVREATWNDGMSVRCRNALFYAGIRSMDELLALSPKHLLRIKNLGMKSLLEMRDFVIARGFLDAPLSRIMVPVPQTTTGNLVPLNPIRRPGRGAPLMRVARRMGRRVCGVYVIACDTTGRRKIGKSIDVALRLSTHAINLPCNELPGPLRLVRLIPCPARSLSYVETSLHWIYEESRIGGREFFGSELTPSPESFRTPREVVHYASRMAEGMQ